MAESRTDSASVEGTALPDAPLIPTDYREYERWRTTGEQPLAETTEATHSAAADQAGDTAGEPPAKTAPTSEADPQGTGTGEPDEHPDDTPEQRKLRAGSRQRRIDRLVKENADLTRRLEESAARPPAAAAAPTATGTEPAPATADPTRAKPQLKSFKTLEEYNEALTDWKLDQREAARRADDEKAQREKALREEVSGWQKKEAAVSKANPDYYETIEAIKAPSGPGLLGMRQALLEEDNGAEVLYHLAKHPDELARIAACSPAKAAAEVGKLAASLSTPDPGNGKPKVSGAPPPPSRLTRAATNTSDSIDDPAVQRDWKRWAKAREAQTKGR